MNRRLAGVALVVLAGCCRPAHGWQAYRLHPFVEATAEQLPGRLTNPAREVAMETLVNDWAHAGLGVGVTGEARATVTVSLSGAAPLLSHLRLRVVGFVKQKRLGHSLDPIFDSAAMMPADGERYMRNFAGIRGFPTVTATSADPVFLWVTADTRGMAPGSYRGAVELRGEDGRRLSMPLRLRVRPHALPLENPLRVCGWQWAASGAEKARWARAFLEYGVNVTHIDADMEVCRAAGYRFFLFVFGPSWRGQPPSGAQDAAADQRIAEIKGVIARLGLKRDEWALYTLDEPNDRATPNQVLWCEYIRKRWPEAQFMFNPGWGPGPRNEWGSVEGTVRPLSPYATVWLPYSAWLSDAAAPVSIALMRESAREVWFYEIMGFSYTRRPAVGREMMRTLAWTAWRNRLQGACWYSLNAYTYNCWDDMSAGEDYGCFYNLVPGRSAEALRQGIQEYKRLHELRRLGVGERELDGFADQVLKAGSVFAIDRVRRQMDDMLLARGTR